MERSFPCVASGINPAYLKFNDELLNNHIRHLQRRLVLLLGATAEVKYRYFLEQYDHLATRVPQWMIVCYLGIPPESLSRHLGIFLKSWVSSYYVVTDKIVGGTQDKAIGK